MSNIGFFFYSFIFWILFLGAFIYAPYMIYKSIKYGKKYGWNYKKVKDNVFYKETPKNILIGSILGIIGGYLFFINGGKLVSYFEKLNIILN